MLTPSYTVKKVATRSWKQSSKNKMLQHTVLIYRKVQACTMRHLIAFNFFTAVSCFTALPTAILCPSNRGGTMRKHFGTRDDEIAKLEDQLRQLREDGTDVGASAMSSRSEVFTKDDSEDAFSLKEFDMARRRLEKTKGKDMLLSEQQLISGGLMEDTSNGRSSGILGIVGAVVALVGLLLFAQVPVGQDELARYSATGSSTIKSIDLGDLNPDTNRS
jgi:hypothetical protein